MTTFIYEVREQSADAPEASRLLRKVETFQEAMAIAQAYNERNVRAFVSRVEVNA